MTKFVQVLVNSPGLNDTFDYHVPDPLVENIRVGSLVQVQFGKQKVQAVVTAFIDTPSVVKTRPILELLYNQPVITAEQLELVEWIARETLSDLSSCLALMLPSGVSQMADSHYRVIDIPQDYPLSPLQRSITSILIEKGGLNGRQLEVRFRHKDWKRSIQALIYKGIVAKEPFLASPTIKPKLTRFIHLLVDPQELNSGNSGLGNRPEIIARRKIVLEFLKSQTEDIHKQVIFAKTGANETDLKRLEEAGLIAIVSAETIRDPLEHIQTNGTTTFDLTGNQKVVWAEIEGIIQKERYQQPVVLHGVTGSGKTEIYLRVVERFLKKDKQALVLVPEISLTPQTVQRFEHRFPGVVGIIHSRLSEGERFDTWRRVLAGEIKVIVGPRSAMFMPFDDLGVIILDEAHDDSYFQSDVSPRYSSLRVAKAYGLIINALVIYGSATPGIEMMYRAEMEHWPVLRLPKRVLAHRTQVSSEELQQNPDQDVIYLPLPGVKIVDMRVELKGGNSSIFSRELSDALTSMLAQGNQAILFLNRRGTATYVFCRNCGYRLDCPRCDLSLTFHADRNLLICHHCNYQRQMPQKCPSCNSPNIRQFGLGTERVEHELRKKFPAARVMRMDSGVTKNKGAHSALLAQFASRGADILVGTQMLAKGLDLPYVTVVGVLLAEVGLGLPDFRANERAFQLLTQVAGRAGRSALGGNVIFQTYQPEHYAIQKAARHDFEGFYQQEIQNRKNIGYPPFSRLLKLEFRSRDENEARQNCEAVAEMIRHQIDREGFQMTELMGPVPPFFQRIGGVYRWQLILRGPKPAAVIQPLKLGNAIITVDPVSLL